MALKRITLHPLNPDGSMDLNTNLYPKTLIDGIVDRDGNEVEVALKEELELRLPVIKDKTTLLKNLPEAGYIDGLGKHNGIFYKRPGLNHEMGLYVYNSSCTYSLRGVIAYNTLEKYFEDASVSNYATEEYVDDNKGTKLYKHEFSMMCRKSGVATEIDLIAISSTATPYLDDDVLSAVNDEGRISLKVKRLDETIQYREAFFSGTSSNIEFMYMDAEISGNVNVYAGDISE